jgi:hypothetical protein
MRRNLTLMVIVLSTACGGGGKSTSDAQMVADSSKVTDAGTDAATGCDPATQAGCDAHQKCTWVTISLMPAVGNAACVPDGTAPIGAPCTQGPPGEATGYDDCVKGGICLNGSCVSLCTNSPNDTCGTGLVCCAPFLECKAAAPVPVCVPACNPVTQTDPNYMDCPAGDGCYLDTWSGKASCQYVPAMAATQKQDDVCYSPFGPQACADNGCAGGYDGVLPLDPSGKFLCSAFCAPANNYKGSHPSLAGIPPHDCSAGRIGKGGTQCRFIQTIRVSDPISAAYGTCVDTSTWGTCSNFDPQGMVHAYNTAFTNTAGDQTAKAAAGKAAVCQFCGLDASCQGTYAPQCRGAGCIDRATEAVFDAMYLGPSGMMIARHIRAMAVQQLRERAHAVSPMSPAAE